MVIKYFTKPFFLAVLICCLFFYGFESCFSMDSNIISVLTPEEITELSGTLLNSPAKISSGKFYSAQISVENVKNSFNTKSSAKGIINIFIPTELVEAYFPGKLYSSAVKKGAYLFESGGKYIFTGNYKSGIFYATQCSNNIWPKNIFGKMDFFRALCRLQFKRLMYSWGKAGGLLLALLCGSKEYTESTISDSFRNAGLSHILALSGMHLSMFSSIAIFVGNRIGRKKLTFIIRITVLILFVWFAGFSPSLLRAFICATLTLLAMIAGTKEPDMILILCASFLLQCIASPSDIYNLGFMLSYGALAGILLFNNFFYKHISRILPDYFSASLASSTSAQFFTIPVSLQKFGTCAPIGIIATSIVSPLITLFIYSGLILIILCLAFPVMMKPSGIFLNLQYTIIKFTVNIFSRCPKWSI